MIKEAMEFLKNDVLVEVPGEDGLRRFAYGGKIHVPTTPLTESILFKSLDGVAGYINEVSSGEGGAWDLFIVVDCSNRIRLLSAVDKWMRRDIIAIASPDLPQIPFGSTLDIESFIVTIMSKFVLDENALNLIKFVGNIKAVNESVTSDDGVSQTVAAKVGITQLANVQVPNPVILKPMRTFPEIEQPSSPFVFRVVPNGKESPFVTLHDCGDSSWKVAAINSIKEYLKGKIGIPVIG